jgi:hypothetical protein
VSSEESLARVTTKVDAFLRSSYTAVMAQSDGKFVVRQKGNMIWVIPFSVSGSPIPAVHVASVSNVQVPISEELTRFLATEGLNLDFGKFELFPNRAQVRISQYLEGDSLTEQKLRVAVDGVASMCERYGRSITERFGGENMWEPV